MIFGHDIPVFYIPCLERPWVLTIFVRYVPGSQHPCGHNIHDLFGRLYISFYVFFLLHEPMDCLGVWPNLTYPEYGQLQPTELHQPIDWLSIKPAHGLVEFCQLWLTIFRARGLS